MESAELIERARRAYERGRLRRALRVAFVVLPLVALSVLAARAPAISLAVGAVLLGAAVLFRWRGRALGAAVGPGLLAGGIPFALLLTLKSGGGLFCALGECMAHCVRFCGAGGLAAGLVLALLARRRDGDGARFLVAGGIVAALTGLLGCFVGGIVGALWMAIGMTGAALPTFAMELRRR